MLKVEQIDGRDALTFKLECGCGVTGAFPQNAGAAETALALIEFAKAVYNLDVAHDAIHKANSEGREVSESDIEAALGVAAQKH